MIQSQQLTLFEGKLWGDLDKNPRCESCDDVEICDVFINDGSEWILLENTSLMPMSDSHSPTLIVLIRSDIIFLRLKFCKGMKRRN